MGQQTLSDEDYQKLKAFLGLYFDWYMAQPYIGPSSHPLLVLEGLEKKSISHAKRGLEMALNDCVELSCDWTPEQVADADQRFAARGMPLLSGVRRRYSREYLRLLKRGSIRSTKEYYLLKGILDGSGLEVGTSELKHLEGMLSEYEKRVVDIGKSKRR